MTLGKGIYIEHFAAGKKSQWIWHWYLGNYEGDVAILWWKYLKLQYKIKFIKPKNEDHILVVKIIKSQ